MAVNETLCKGRHSTNLGHELEYKSMLVGDEVRMDDSRRRHQGDEALWSNGPCGAQPDWECLMSSTDLCWCGLHSHQLPWDALCEGGTSASHMGIHTDVGDGIRGWWV